MKPASPPLVILAQLWDSLEKIPRLWDAISNNQDHAWSIEAAQEIRRAAAEFAGFAISCEAIATINCQAAYRAPKGLEGGN